MGDTVTIDIAWEWAFGELVDDTIHAGKSPSVEAVVTVSQVD
jgi:hypothetical protein